MPLEQIGVTADNEANVVRASDVDHIVIVWVTVSAGPEAGFDPDSRHAGALVELIVVAPDLVIAVALFWRARIVEPKRT